MLGIWCPQVYDEDTWCNFFQTDSLGRHYQQQTFQCFCWRRAYIDYILFCRGCRRQRPYVQKGFVAMEWCGKCGKRGFRPRFWYNISCRVCSIYSHLCATIGIIMGRWSLLAHRGDWCPTAWRGSALCIRRSLDCSIVVLIGVLRSHRKKLKIVCTHMFGEFIRCQ